MSVHASVNIHQMTLYSSEEKYQNFLNEDIVIKINNICSRPCGVAITFDAFPGISQSVDNVDWWV